MINRKGWASFVIVLALALMLAGCGGAVAPSSWAGLVTEDHVLYLAATSEVVAVGTAEGDRLWTFKSEVSQPGLFGQSTSVIPVHAAPAVDDGLVFIGSDGQPKDNGRVRALSIDDGQERWQFPPAGQAPLGNIFAGLAAGDGVVYCAATDQVYALDAASGRELWHVSVGSRVWGTPLLAGDRLYVGTLNHQVLALDVAKEGKLVWKFDEARGAIAGSPILDGDTLYIGSFDNTLYALNASTGQKRWSYVLQGWLWDGLTVMEDKLYVGDMSGYVQALTVDDERATPVWAQPVKVAGGVRAAPLYVPAGTDWEESLIVLDDSGDVTALDPGTSELRWVAHASSGRLLTQPVWEDGVVIIATLSGPVQVYGLDIAAVPAAYLQQEVKGSTRAPVALYRDDAVNNQVVRWHVAPLAKSQ
ncbi:MAG: PQQ-binding-like beta-propeller repeat protein [Thermoflexales bacterium]|nr:PQQ-binding-like beta-propeller repeat protein [Thermoflexales bacterium]